MRKQKLTDSEKFSRPYGELVLLAGNTGGLMRTARADLKIIRILPGASTSLHKHLVAESIFHVVAGELSVITGSKQRTNVRKGDTFIVEPGESHQIINDGGTIGELLEVECRSASKTDPPSARDSAKPSGATLRCAPPGLALPRHNLKGGQLFDADPGQLFGAV